MKFSEGDKRFLITLFTLIMMGVVVTATLHVLYLKTNFQDMTEAWHENQTKTCIKYVNALDWCLRDSWSFFDSPNVTDLDGINCEVLPSARHPGMFSTGSECYCHQRYNDTELGACDTWITGCEGNCDGILNERKNE